MKAREGKQIVADGEQKVNRGLLDDRGNASAYLKRAPKHVEAQHQCRAAGRAAECSKDLQCGGFASGVRSQQAEESAGRGGEGKAIYSANRRPIKKVFSAKAWSPE